MIENHITTSATQKISTIPKNPHQNSQSRSPTISAFLKKEEGIACRIPEVLKVKEENRDRAVI